MPRTPRSAAILWGLIGFVVGLGITLALAFARQEPNEPRDAMYRRGQAAAPFVGLAAAIPAAIAYYLTKKKQS